MARFPLVPTAPEPERAVLVGVEWRDNAWPIRLALSAWRVCHSVWLNRIQNRLSDPVRLRSFAGSCIEWMPMLLSSTMI